MDAPEPWQCGFQDPATHVMEGIIDLHHDIVFVLFLILVFVLWMLAMTIHHFSHNATHEKTIQCPNIEMSWSVVPSIL